MLDCSCLRRGCIRHGRDHLCHGFGYCSLATASGQQNRKPLVIKRESHPWRLAQDRIPQLPGFGSLAPTGESTCLEQSCDQRLQPLGRRMVDSRLPVLHGASADAQTPREMALGQSGPPTQAQQKVAKGSA